MGGDSLPLFFKEGGDMMTIFQALVLMISFSSLIVAILSFHQKK
ncbi:putative holin-like toxin [Oceanobacillus bengalensis]